MSAVKATHRIRRFFAYMLLVLSIAPFSAFLISNSVSRGPAGGSSGVRAAGNSPWAAPRIEIPAADLTYKPPPAYRHYIPVLLYHGVNYKTDDVYNVSPESFSEQMALLHRLGYHTISMAQYLAWREGKRPALPSRPILLTFDDGRFDTYRGADLILKRYGMRATIFVIVGQIQKGNLFYCSWDELRKMQRSGRWDIQFHANNGHVRVPYNAKGQDGAFYAVREWIGGATGHRETMAHYIARVRGDVDQGIALMRRHNFPNLVTMAMPFGEYGQHPVETVHDEAAKRELDKILNARFTSVFVQSGTSYTPYSSPSARSAVRKEIRNHTTIKQLYRFLYGADPTVFHAKERACLRPGPPYGKPGKWDPINEDCYR